jgi:FKBP-type peptidyl-prolyl cis-trans isomerase 2
MLQRMTRTASRFALLLLVLAVASCAPATVQEKKVVQIAYTGTLADGSVFSQSEKDKPLEFLVGGGRIIPALEKALVGLKVGDQKKIIVRAADAYGEYDKGALQEVSKDRFPQGSTFSVGQKFVVQTPNGPYPVRIAEVRVKSVIVDFNHPLAGKDLTFDVVVVKIRDATTAELAPPAPAAAPQASAETGKK